MWDYLLVIGILILVAIIWLGLQVVVWSSQVSKVKDTSRLRQSMLAFAVIGPIFAFLMLLVGGILNGNQELGSLILLPVFVGVSVLLSFLGLKIAIRMNRNASQTRSDEVKMKDEPPISIANNGNTHADLDDSQP